jgi:RNA polymerase sigma factor (sigma-70 family)
MQFCLTKCRVAFERHGSPANGRGNTEQSRNRRFVGIATDQHWHSQNDETKLWPSSYWWIKTGCCEDNKTDAVVEARFSMPTSSLNVVIQHLVADLRPDGDGTADGELLARFLKSRDEEALASLVRRHAMMVWGVCCRLLGSHHDAEDAFQATFLVLVRKAGAVPKQAIANWLYGVARQTAVRVRATAMKRGQRETQVVNMPEPTVAETRDGDLRSVLDEELSRLPNHYRGVIVLCDLEGMTRKDVACQLGIPEGSVASRLARARALLAKRLNQRGIRCSGGSVTAIVSAGSAFASVPPDLVLSTIKAASVFAAGPAAAVASATVVSLAEGVVKAMFVTKIKAAIAVVLILCFVATGTTIFASRLTAGQDDKKSAAEKAAELAAKQAELAATPAKTEELKITKDAGDSGESVAGLRIKLQLDVPMKGAKSPSYCAVTIENVGDADLNVNLGVSLGNGKSHHPVALRLLATEGSNTTRLTYAAPAVAGRLDPFVIPLPVGSSYTLRCPLDKFVLPDGGGRFDFTAKDYQIKVELDGQPVKETNPDLRGFTLMRFWKGTSQSNQKASSSADAKKP